MPLNWHYIKMEIDLLEILDQNKTVFWIWTSKCLKDTAG